MSDAHFRTSHTAALAVEIEPLDRVAPAPSYQRFLEPDQEFKAICGDWQKRAESSQLVKQQC